MKRAILALGLAVLIAGQAGCLAVSAKNNRYRYKHEVVAVDGQAYLINLETGKVQQIDLSDATPYEPESAEVTEYNTPNA